MRKSEIKYLLINKRYIEAEIRDIAYQIEEVESLENISVGGVSYEERIQSTNISSSTEKQAIRNVLKVADLKKEKTKLEFQIKRLDEGMNILTKIEKDVLELKFIENNKWEYVNKKLRGGDLTCKFISVRAIDKLSKIMK